MMLLKPDADVTIYEPCGCPRCDGTGFRGRIGVYEIMEISQPLRRIISRKGTTEDIKKQALLEGMNTLRMSAAKYVLQGITSVQEMMRVSFDL